MTAVEGENLRISGVDEPLTPREARLERAARGLRWGAIANIAAAVLVMLAGVVAALSTSPDLFNTLRSILVARFAGAQDVALLTVILLLLVNASVLLVVMVGVLAQEFWALLVAALFVVANVGMLVVFGFTPVIVSFAALIWAGYVLLPDLRAFRTNPVMLKELRERMRGARAFAVISVYLALMSAFTILLYVARAPFNQGFSSAATGDLGRTLFIGIVGFEIMLIVFIAPAFTAGAVTGERERKTYDLLQITLLPRPTFIIGKLESSLGYIFLLLLAAIPLQSIAFLFGGVTEAELILSFVILVVTAVTLGTVGLFFSTLAERTLAASVRAYTFAFAVLFGIPAAGAFISSLFYGVFTGGGTTTFTGPPALEAFLQYFNSFLVSLNPISTGLQTQQLLITQQVTGFWYSTLSSTGGTIPLASPWISFTILYLMIAAVMIVLSVRRIRQSEF